MSMVLATEWYKENLANYVQTLSVMSCSGSAATSGIRYMKKRPYYYYCCCYCYCYGYLLESNMIIYGVLGV